MDAREYLNRKGVPLDRDPDKPNTLEEKAWERARGAGHQRPKVGTPHDWEEWERYHEDLAEGSESLEQKIDKQAHRHATEHASGQAKPEAGKLEENRPEAGKSEASGRGVEHFTPPPKASVDVPTKAESPSATPSPALKTAYYFLAVLLPPLALVLSGAGGRRIALGVLLTLAGWLPGVIVALVWLRRRFP
ncbi:YqaE/Pmp3 family membrane protein [Vreelandella rituensis]|uniref:YqaE/Pmp3 family membrane protein n=1 Tax=Vreelandella rituensis TaxID=2282306 RepID=A0A368U2X8_9GAMM|nr:YqaE/Pmp3 family membrane protein [Halomonas rituensis]RCV91408.1 YqaE/Pmp3 family membrane protein [Halomonas rituensis]